MGATLDREWADPLRDRRGGTARAAAQSRSDGPSPGLVCSSHCHIRLRGIRREVHAGLPACNLYQDDHVDERRIVDEPVDRPAECDLVGYQAPASVCRRHLGPGCRWLRRVNCGAPPRSPRLSLLNGGVNPREELCGGKHEPMADLGQQVGRPELPQVGRLTLAGRAIWSPGLRGRLRVTEGNQPTRPFVP